METAQSRSFESADEVREFPYGEARVLTLGDVTIGLGRLQPGWSFATSMKHLVGADECPFRHVGYAMSGRMTVRMSDGSTLDIGAGEAYVIPSGHTAEIVGDEEFVALEFDTGAIDRFGKAAD